MAKRKRKQTWHGLSSPDWTIVEWKRRRRGPAPGTVARYRESDRKLYPEVERIMRGEHKTVTAAARQLAEQGKVAGTGIKESRARRLPGQYRADHRKSPWHAG
jgi:hypothetical protein